MNIYVFCEDKKTRILHCESKDLNNYKKYLKIQENIERLIFTSEAIINLDKLEFSPVEKIIINQHS